MQKWNFSEAYGVLRSKLRLGPQPNFALALIKYYVTLMLTEQFEIADSVYADLESMIWIQFKDTSSDLVNYAEQLRNNQQYMESVLFYRIAFSFSKNENDLAAFSELLDKISFGMNESVKRLKRGHFITSNVIQFCFIPFFRTCLETAKARITHDLKTSAWTQAKILLIIVFCHNTLRDTLKEKSNSEEAVEIMKKALGKHPAMKLSCYGAFLTIIAKAHWKLNNVKGCIDFYNKAIEAIQKAKDYPSENAKSDAISRLRDRLKYVQRHAEMLKR